MTDYSHERFRVWHEDGATGTAHVIVFGKPICGTKKRSGRWRWCEAAVPVGEAPGKCLRCLARVSRPPKPVFPDN